MKVLVGSLQCEANTFVPFRADINDFEIHKGDAALEKLAAVKVFRENGVEVLPLIFASALPSGMVKRQAFEYFKTIFCEIVEKIKMWTESIFICMVPCMWKVWGAEKKRYCMRFGKQ